MDCCAAGELSYSPGIAFRNGIIAAEPVLAPLLNEFESPMSLLKILLIDDHALFRSGLQMVLASGLESVEIGEMSSVEESVRLVPGVPDIVLLDIQLQGLNGLDGIVLLQQRWPATAIVVLSSDDTSQARKRAFELGAVAFVSKADSADNILALIERIRSGQLTTSSPAAASMGDDGRPRLTPRQCEVLDLLCQGLSNKMIGRRLELSENTVRWHVQALLTALQASSRSEAAFLARRCGLVN
jgi:DNA-binding NarL/FixJ family response regulator